ncbi:MAG TPA: 2Fe-2S iron-sulfur cluster-binding protein, partial [Candidatus Aminicenantes bacterium]|nr:2Fe-2S iron-sulfur cluster-binding protein [Candidatus Aminicenantes bacterium]
MTKTHEIEIVSPSARLSAAEGSLLADCLETAGIPISLYCRKRGICGKCFVEILEGELPPPGEMESWLLAQRGLPPNCRLSCLYRVRSRVRLRIPEAFRLGKMSILDTGMDVPADFSPCVRKYFVKLAESTLHAPHSPAEGLERFFRRRLLLPLDVLRSLPGVEDEGGGEFTAVVFRENEILSLERGDTTSANWGAAVD